MPKEIRAALSSPRASPYPSSSSSCSYRRHSSSLTPPNHGSRPSAAVANDFKELQEVRCPVCMEPPHNAVLLLCSSRDKGCRPFMCNTSHRHSNCLWQYRKSLSESRLAKDNDTKQPSDLTCPLCRGAVTGWTINEPARNYMNSISRSCSLECCEFAGSYRELRRHARQEHPTLRPSEADPVRQRDWRRIEEEQDFNDLMSIMRSELSREQDVGRMEERQGLDEWFSLSQLDNFQEDVGLGTRRVLTFMVSRTAFTIHRTGTPPSAFLRSLASAIQRWILVPLPNAREGGRQEAPAAIRQGQSTLSSQRQVITSDVEVDGDVEGGRQEAGRQEAPPAFRRGPSTLSWQQQVITSVVEVDDDEEVDADLNPTGI